MCWCSAACRLARFVSAGQEGERHVEGVGDVFLGRLHVGQGGQVAHRVAEQLHLQAALGDDAPGRRRRGETCWFHCASRRSRSSSPITSSGLMMASGMAWFS